MLDVPTADADVLFESIRHVESRVTVCITLYNYAAFVTETLDSVANQGLEHLDLAVVDDMSADDGAERVLQWLESCHTRFGRALLLRHRENQGLAAARNQGFASAATPYIFVLDADNQLYPRCLAVCLETAEANGADMVHTILEVFGEQRGLMGTDVWDPDALQRGNYIDAMALISRSAWQRVGGYRRTPVPGWEDYDFWLKFAEAGLGPCRVPEILCRYRHHRHSMLRHITNQPESVRELHADMRLHHPSVRLSGS